MAAVQVTLSDLTQKVNEGWKRDALAEHYGLPKKQMSDLLRTAGLKIRKFHAPKFELVDDLNATEEAPIVEEISTVAEEVQAEVSETITVEGTTVPPTLQESW